MIKDKTALHWSSFQRLIQTRPISQKNRTYRLNGVVSNPTLVAISEQRLWVVTTALDPFRMTAPSDQDCLSAILNTYIVYRSLRWRNRRPFLTAYLTDGRTQFEVASDKTVICNASKRLLRNIQAPDEISVRGIVEKHRIHLNSTPGVNSC